MEVEPLTYLHIKDWLEDDSGVYVMAKELASIIRRADNPIEVADALDNLVEDLERQTA